MKKVDNFYGVITPEIDLRFEIQQFFDGSYQGIPKAIPGVLRRMKRDSDNNPIFCPCTDKVTHEADKDYFCPICFGERYLWQESLIEYYQVFVQDDGHGSSGVWNSAKQYGLINISQVIFYMKYNIIVDNRDKLVSVLLDTEGNIINPIKRQFIWRINNISSLRSDHGRIEFLKLFCNNEDAKYLSPPKG